MIVTSLLSQLKDMAERLPPGTYDTDNFKLAYPPNGTHFPDTNGEHHSRSNSTNGSVLASPTGPNINSGSSANGTHGPSEGAPRSNEPLPNPGQGPVSSNGGDEYPDANGSNSTLQASGNEPGSVQEGENGTKPKNLVGPGNGNQVDAEWIEQYEPGVYITLVALRDGTRDLKRVRFR